LQINHSQISHLGGGIVVHLSVQRLCNSGETRYLQQEIQQQTIVEGNQTAVESFFDFEK
jgi:hypothetical protein